MANVQPEEEVKPGAPEWVVTFGDMMSLLLCFFILILSFSTIEVQKFKAVAGFLREAFNLGTFMDKAQIDAGFSEISPTGSAQLQNSKDFITLQLAREAIEKSGMEDFGHVRMTDRGVTIRMEGDSFFESGSSKLSEQAETLLQEIVAIAEAENGTIEVEGHTDDVPISTPQYPSNWELSSARAGSAARYLTSHGVPSSRIKAIGYADTKPVVPNTSDENRAKNRRVEILFVKENGPRRGAKRETLASPGEFPFSGRSPFETQGEAAAADKGPEDRVSGD